MNGYFPLLLCLFSISVIFGQEIPSLRSLALDKAAEKLHKQLIKPQSFKNRLSLIKKWDKRLGFVTPKAEVSQETIVERFGQKFFTKLEEFETFDNPVFAITNDNCKVILRKDNSAENALAVIDLQTKKIIHTLIGHTYIIKHVAVSADNSRAISTTYDNSLILWDLNTGQSISKISGFDIKDIALNSNNDKAITISHNDNTLILWDLNTGQPIHRLKGHDNLVECIAISPDNSTAISTSNDRAVIWWDLEKGQSIQNTKDRNSPQIINVAITNNDKALYRRNNNWIELWDIVDGKENLLPSGSLSHIENIDILLTPDSKKAVYCFDRDKLIVFDVINRKIIHTLQGHTNTIKHVKLSPNNNRVISVSYNETIMWDLNLGQKLQHIKSKARPVAMNNSFVGMGKKLFKIEDWQSIILNMPRESKTIIQTPFNLLDVKQVGALRGLYQAQLEKQKVPATNQSH